MRSLVTLMMMNKFKTMMKMIMKEKGRTMMRISIRKRFREITNKIFGIKMMILARVKIQREKWLKTNEVRLQNSAINLNKSLSQKDDLKFSMIAYRKMKMRKKKLESIFLNNDSHKRYQAKIKLCKLSK